MDNEGGVARRPSQHLHPRSVTGASASSRGGRIERGRGTISGLPVGDARIRPRGRGSPCDAGRLFDRVRARCGRAFSSGGRPADSHRLGQRLHGLRRDGRVRGCGHRRAGSDLDHGFDDIFVSALPEIDLTTPYNRNSRQLGASAAELLLERIASNGAAGIEADSIETDGPRDIIVPTELIVRGTTASAPQ